MKIFVSDENLDPQHMLFCREIRFVARALFDFVCLKFSLEIFSVKTPTRGVFMLYTSFSIFSIFFKKRWECFSLYEAEYGTGYIV